MPSTHTAVSAPLTPSELGIYARLFNNSPLGFLKEDDPQFSEQLALKNDWSPEYARRVIHEYRRFIYLAMHADQPLVSSEQIDQVMQFDLAHRFTFWAQACVDISQSWSTFRKTESYDYSKWDNPYQTTLDAYQSCWGRPAPEDIWSEPSVRQLSDFPEPCQSKESPLSSVISWLFFLGGIAFLLYMLDFSVKSDSPWFGVLFVLIFMAMAILGFFFSETCKRCNRHRAVHPSGVALHVISRFEKLAQSRCKHCGKVEWSISDLREDNSGGGGGG